MAISFSPVRVKAATQEAAIEQALNMTGAEREEIEFEVLEESDKGVTIRVAPLGSLPAKQTEPTAQTAEPLEDQEPIVDEAQDQDIEPEVEVLSSADSEEAEQASGELDEEPPQVAALERPSVREASDEVKDHARILADEILERMGLEAHTAPDALPEWCLPTSHDKSERVRDVPRAFLKIEGEDVGILIGKHGNTLQSFQYLLNLMLNNAPDQDATEEGVREGGVHVVVDAGEYRSRRAQALERQALDAAARAKRDRRAIRLDPMPGHERRLIHLALYEDKEIASSSEGRDPWRRVVIAPAGMRVESRGGGYNNRHSERGGNGQRGGYGQRGSGGRGFGGSGSSRGGGRRSYN
jgi:spoIIIJ-associated protein